MTDQRDDSKTQEPAKATPAPAGDDTAAQQKSARKDAPEAKQDKPEAAPATGAGPVLTTQDVERMKAGEDAPRREGEVRVITEVNPGTAN